MSNSPYPCFSLLLLLLLCMCQQDTADGRNGIRRMDVGVILDMGSWIGKMSKSCISMALSDYYSAHKNYTTRLVLRMRDTREGIVEAASAAIDLVKNVQVQAILGPLTSSQAEFVIDIGNKALVPIISFSATSPSLSSTQTPYFVRAALNDSTQVHAIAAIIKAFSWREVVPIHEASEHGKDIIPYLTDALQEVNARVPYRSIISVMATNDEISGELYKLMTMQTRVFVVHMTPSLGSRLFQKAKEIGMMSKGYVWIITDGLTDLLGSTNSSIFDSMQGVLGVKPYVPRSIELGNFRSRWKRNFIQQNPEIDTIELSVLGLWAYDSIWALAMAADKVAIVHPQFKKPKNEKNSTDLDRLGISQMGPSLLRAITETQFRGLSGNFWLMDGQLQSSAFQIVNVIGKGGREIGFWSPAFGISEKLELTSRRTYSTSMDDLQAIIWPGESTVIPKGWELPTNERKLRIGVPVKNGFTEFVRIHTVPQTNETTVSGFCIDVFKAVVDSVPYAVPFEFIPFANDKGQSAGTYNDLIDQVYFQNYDGVVGDVTIRANRSLHVDFTLPFTESGVSLIVPIKNDQRKNGWIFLKPLTRDLWLTIGGFFIFTGFVVWVIEHGINDDFRGSPSHQLGMIFWFSFSTLVFAHKERVMGNLSRFVLIIWIFVVLILTSSYTASLTSRLTVQKLQPTITDINDLIKTGEFVGYQSGSFVKELLERLGVHASKHRVYNNLEQYHEALSKGSQGGGVSAILDEVPYIKLFLARYCKKYMMIGPIYKTAGFGFAFPKGSPLVSDMSRAVLNVTEGEKMTKIEKAWFGDQTNCAEQGGTTGSSDSLTLDSFKGLFLIAAGSSTSALLYFFFYFLFENKHILTSNASLLQKVLSLAKEFDKKKEGRSGASPNVATAEGEANGPAEHHNVATADGEANGPAEHHNVPTADGEVDGAAEHHADPPPSPPISIPNNGDPVLSQENLRPTEPSTPIQEPPALFEITEVRGFH